MKTALFYCGHPAQYHFLKHTMRNLKKAGWQVVVLIKTKDILEQLLQEDGIPYVNIQPTFRKNNKLAILKASFDRTFTVVKIARQYKADILIGTDSSIAQAGWLLRKPAITTLEDDYDVIKNLAKLTYPFTTHIIVPNICRVGSKWEKKKVGYEGYMKLAYLHPRYFEASPEMLRKYKMPIDKPYVMIRMAKLVAHHDEGIRGLSVALLGQMIGLCEEQGYQVYITSEIALPEEYQKYQLKISHTDIHHILAQASMLISDSQSMSVEAAMLGVPSVRYSDFSGRISVLEELEKKYELTYGIKATEPEALVAKVKELLAEKNLREEWQKHREKMLSEKIDVTAFLTYFIENYPQSAAEARNADRSFWKRFK